MTKIELEEFIKFRDHIENMIEKEIVHNKFLYKNRNLSTEITIMYYSSRNHIDELKYKLEEYNNYIKKNLNE